MKRLTAVKINMNSTKPGGGDMFWPELWGKVRGPVMDYYYYGEHGQLEQDDPNAGVHFTIMRDELRPLLLPENFPGL